MLDPVLLAQQERNKEAAIALQRRLNQQKREENNNTTTGFWQGFNPDDRTHEIRTLDGGVIPCQSFHPTGFQPDQVLTVARSAGESLGRIRVRR